MSKSYEDYDKITAADRVLSAARVFGLGFLGALVGSIPAVVLLCFFNITTAFAYIVSGCTVAVFYGSFIKKENRRWFDHISMVISMFLGLFAAQFVSYMLHYAPQWNLDGKEMNVFQKTVFAYFRYTGFDSMKINENRLYFVTDGGTLSVYTVLIAALIMAVIGMYGAFIFMHIGEKRDAQNESGRKKGKRSRNRRG